VERIVIIILILSALIGLSLSYCNKLSTQKQEELPELAQLAMQQAQGIILERSQVDINRANRYRLSRLHGIGPQLAQRIINYRQENGPFHSPEELMNVRGIGPKKYAAIRDGIRIDE